MFNPIPDVVVPSDDTVIWRYMGFAALLSILERKALFFPTIDLLRKIDPWEASFSNWIPRVLGFYSFSTTEKDKEEDRKRFEANLASSASKEAGAQAAVSCWHMNEHESDAMWKLYSRDRNGVALRTTFGRLKAAFDTKHPNWPNYGGPSEFAGNPIELRAGEVEYIDWGITQAKNDITLKQFLYKHISLNHEQELRIIAQLAPFPGFFEYRYSDVMNELDLGISDEVMREIERFDGVYLPVSVNTLIESVYVAPIAPLWFEDLVEQVIPRYGFEPEIIHWSNKRPRY